MKEISIDWIMIRSATLKKLNSPFKLDLLLPKCKFCKQTAMVVRFLQAQQNHLSCTNLPELTLQHWQYDISIFCLNNWCLNICWVSANFCKVVPHKWFFWACKYWAVIAACLQKLHLGSKRPNFKYLVTFSKWRIL